MSGGEGYVFDIAYRAGFNSGSVLGSILTEWQANGRTGFDLDGSFTVLDLGCGRGLTLTVLAAAFPNGRFVGIDLNPHHIAEASARARRLGLHNLSFRQGSFSSPDVAGVEMVEVAIAQGIYSWVSAEDQALLLDFLAQSIRPGGIIQMSYNLEPGFAQMRPVRDLFLQLIQSSDLPPAIAREHALDVIVQLLANQAPFFAANPEARENVRHWTVEQLDYLSHEFLNQNWHLNSFSQVAQRMSELGLQFAGTPLSQREDGQVWADGVGSGLNLPTQEDLAAFALAASFRNDLYSDEAPTGQMCIPNEAVFGPFCPPDLPAVQPHISGDHLAAKIAAACYVQPRSWSKLVQMFPEAEKKQIASALVGAIRQRLITRYITDARINPQNSSGEFIFASQLSREVVDDAELAKSMQYFPSQAFGGAVAVPPAVSQAFAALIDTSSFADAVTELQARMVRILGMATPPKLAHVEKTLTDAQNIWVPHLLKAGVLVQKSNDPAAPCS